MKRNLNLKLGDIFSLKNDIKYRNRIIKKDESVVIGSWLIDERCDLYYCFWIVGENFNPNSNTYRFRLHSSLIERQLETKEQRRQRIIKELI